MLSKLRTLVLTIHQYKIFYSFNIYVSVVCSSIKLNKVLNVWLSRFSFCFAQIVGGYCKCVNLRFFLWLSIRFFKRLRTQYTGAKRLFTLFLELLNDAWILMVILFLFVQTISRNYYDCNFKTLKIKCTYLNSNHRIHSLFGFNCLMTDTVVYKEKVVECV